MEYAIEIEHFSCRYGPREAVCDFWRLRLPFVCWAAVLVFGAVFLTTTPALSITERMSSVVHNTVATFHPVVEILIMLGLTSLIVHADPAVGSDAFWMTRPIPPIRLFAAKLATAGVVL